MNKLTKLQKAIFYILNLTWGLPMTLIGGLASLVLIVMGKKPVFVPSVTITPRFVAYNYWGGVSLGIFTITQENASQSLTNHELGHACQNAVYGPFMIFIAIASCIRYWYRELFPSKIVTGYDEIWFEGQATKWGNWLVERW